MDGEGALVVQDGARQVGTERLAHQQGPVVARLGGQPHRAHAHLPFYHSLRDTEGQYVEMKQGQDEAVKREGRTV